MNIQRTSFLRVPSERMIPISLIRSVTDIIMMFKILIPATRREIPPITVVKVDI